MSERFVLLAVYIVVMSTMMWPVAKELGVFAPSSWEVRKALRTVWEPVALVPALILVLGFGVNPVVFKCLWAKVKVNR